ncbi:GNAT family N-acetyltransferase [Cryobacterium cryoconiti]|uniref:GNAT family N-acetyltransferase n=1 Tax=Cryobacterium cryoconiti TaxID=1259239 RepID=A0A4Y8JUP0_9MICO|nr:GNAT family N-acetyltransferase [Cryobacterium cryoconiti]TFD30017.1 GNAT family N-acetyltransferase [Cryobacterium cryoconiti]
METFRFEIEELTVPAAPQAPGWADFVAANGVRNTVEAEAYGTVDLELTADEVLPGWLNQRWEPKRLFVARTEGRIVGHGHYETLPEDSADHAWLAVGVLPEYRGRGIGTALADRLEAVAHSEGRSVQIVYAPSPDAPGERLPSPTGFGSVPLDNPEVRFLQRRGYLLEQVVRASRLPLPVDPVQLRRLGDLAALHAGPDYSVVQWIDRTPPVWLPDLAVLYSRMSTDAPSAGLAEPEQRWTPERVSQEEQKVAASPRTTLTSAVLHGPSGHLVGFTELEVPAELGRAVSQEDTLVLREHRGRRLGMLLKIANLELLTLERTGHPSVLTYNAEENRHMLTVNEAIGFAPMGYEGAWRRDAQ